MTAAEPLLPHPGAPPPPTSRWRRTRIWRVLALVSLVGAVIMVLERAGLVSRPGHGAERGFGLVGDPMGWGVGVLGGTPGLSLGVGRAVRGLRVAVVEPTGYHAEVLSSILSVLDDMYINATAYTWSESVSSTINHFRPGVRAGAELAAAIDAGEHDMVVLNTCDAKFWEHQVSQVDALFRIGAWAGAAGASKGTLPRVICIPHELERYGDAHDDIGLLSAVAEVARLDHVVLAKHSERSLVNTLAGWSQRIGQGYWERASRGVESFVPVFPLPALPPRITRDRVHKAGIVGRISGESRDYNGTFVALERAILHNPALWGYGVINVPVANTTRTRLRLIPMGRPDADNPNPQRVPDYNESNEAFTLHLIGYAGDDLRIPGLLNDAQWPVVRVQSHEDVDDYYAAIRDMDVILPAFSDDAYFESRASASIPAAIMANTPLLVTSRHLEAYSYLPLYPSSYILSPLALSTMDALGALRRGADPWDEEFGDTLPRPGVELAAGAESWDAYLDILRAENRRVWARVLARAVVL